MTSEAVTMTAADDPVLLGLEATRRGFKSALAFRRWCKRHGVPIGRDGRKEWVRPRDVSAAAGRAFPPPKAPAVADLAALARASVQHALGGS